MHSTQTPSQCPQRPFFPDLRAPPLEMLLLLQSAGQAAFHTFELWDANREEARDEGVGGGRGARVEEQASREHPVCTPSLMPHTPQV